MRPPVVNYREFRLSRINEPRFAHVKLLAGWIVYFALYFITENLIPESRCHLMHCALDDLSLEDMKSVSPAFEEDVYEALSMKACIERRNTTGAPGPKAMEEEIRAAEEILKQ